MTTVESGANLQKQIGADPVYSWSVMVQYQYQDQFEL